MDAHGSTGRFAWLFMRTGLALVVFLIIAGFFLVTEHTAHLFGVLPFLFLLACPIMHVFMHGGHDHTGHADATQPEDHAGHAGSTQHEDRAAGGGR